MNQVRDYIDHASHIPIRCVCYQPFGIGLYLLDSAFDKDLVMAGNVHDINGIQVSFITLSIDGIGTSLGMVG
jgi:hypothetical protein